MQELNIGKEQFESMPNEVLIHFARNESIHLTFDSFHLLMTEFRLRNLDIKLIDYKISHGLNTNSTFLNLPDVDRISDEEHSEAIEYTDTIWNFVLDEKEKGETNYKIYNAILEYGINEDYAYLFIKNLEQKAREYFELHDNRMTNSWLLIIGGFLLFCFSLGGSSIGLLLSIGLLGFVHGIIKFSESSSKRDKYQRIINNIQEEKENLNIINLS